MTTSEKAITRETLAMANGRPIVATLEGGKLTLREKGRRNQIEIKLDELYRLGAPPEKTVEVTRSVSFKMNLGSYENIDFFACQKAVCGEGMRDEVSADLDDWCLEEIRASIRKFKTAREQKGAA